MRAARLSLALAVVVAALAAFPRAVRAEVPPLSDEELKARATHIVVGKVQAIYAYQAKRTAAGVDRVSVGEVLVSTVEKGEGLEQGKVVYARWWNAGERPPGWTGPGGLHVGFDVGDEVRFFLDRGADGAFDVLRPNGAAVVAKGPGAPGTDAKPSAGAPGAAAETVEALQAEVTKLLVTAAAGDDAATVSALKSLLLPDAKAWFDATFGAEAGARGAAEYAEMTSDAALKGVPAFLGSMAKQVGQHPVEAYRAEGDRATGAQKKALDEMKAPVGLYTARVGGMTLWSFAFVDGAWRLVGKMRAVAPK